MKNLLNKSLPKWPGLIVVGQNVTSEQAKNILIKTCSLSRLSTNKKDFAERIYSYVYGFAIPTDDEYRYSLHQYFNNWDEMEEAVAAINKKTGSIADQLGYLANHQIVSCWIGGPHGWCDWQGNIGTSNYNIGKWPNCEEVYNEWVLIAKTFPYLNLRAQLLSGETCEEDTKPVIEFIIKDGTVTVEEPKELLKGPTKPDWSNFNDRDFEIGCTFGQFKEAYDFVTKAYENDGWKLTDNINMQNY